MFKYINDLLSKKFDDMYKKFDDMYKKFDDMYKKFDDTKGTRVLFNKM